MSLAASTGAPCPPRPQLRLVAERKLHASGQPRGDELSRTRAVPGDERAHVLVAGGLASTRSRMLAELRNLLPESTRYLEARETWEVLARAPSSQMVVLTDDLGDVSAGSLVRLLGRRHPTLPVLAVGDRARPSGSADVGTVRP